MRNQVGMTAFRTVRRAIPPALALIVFVLSSAPALAADGGPVPYANLITLDTTPSGLLVAVNGTPVQAPYSFPCDPGTSRVISAPSPQVNGSFRYTFVSWSDGGNGSHVISCDAPANLTASFRTEYELRVESFPTGRQVEIGGMPYTTPAAIWCLPNSSRFVNAFQQQLGGVRYTPMNWSDGGAIGHTVLCDSPRSLTLFFLTEYAVGLFSLPGNGFTILLDGAVYRTPAVYWCTEGTVHTLDVPSPQTAPPDSGQYAFDHWIDFGPVGRTFVCNFSANYTAVFVLIDAAGPPPSPFSGVGTLLIVFGVVVLSILIPVLILWRVDRRRPAVAMSPPPAPVGMRAVPAPPRRCPTCSASAAADWRYCIACGGDLPG